MINEFEIEVLLKTEDGGMMLKMPDGKPIKNSQTEEKNQSMKISSSRNKTLINGFWIKQKQLKEN